MANKKLKILELAGESYDIPILGVKGQREEEYRDGEVNLTPDDILYFGENPIADISEDLMSVWRSKGTGYCFIRGAGQINGQPTNNGWLLNIVFNDTSGINQYWFSYANGKTWYRSTNASATTMPDWTPLGQVSGVKGQQETDYRTGDVNITPDNIAFLGNNPSTLAQDTKEWWASKGTGYAWYSTANLTNGQPSTYGFLISYVRNGVVAQEWHAMNSGTIYFRGAGGSATTMPNWQPVNTDTTYTPSDSNPLMDGEASPGTYASYSRSNHRHPTDTTRAPLANPTFTGTPKAPTISDKSTSSTQLASSAFVQGAIARRLVGVSGTNVAQFNCANSTYVYKTIFTAPSKGTLIVTGEACFASNATGYRLIGLRKGTTGNWLTRATNTPVSGNSFINVTRIADLESGDVVSAAYWQNSGATLTVSQHTWACYFIAD